MATATLEQRTTVTAGENPSGAPERTLGAKGGQEPHSKVDGLDNRVRKAAARYLELRGYEILEQDWECDRGSIDIVCKDEDGTLVFVDAHTAHGDFPNVSCDAARRSKLETMALNYLAENEFVDVAVRFDTVCVVPVGSNRALLRHQVNSLGSI